MNLHKLAAAIAFTVAAPAVLSAQQVITNGGFESGFAGWSKQDQANGSGSWYSTAGGTAPSTLPILAPAGGALYAVTDQPGPGSHMLYQSFTLSSAATSATLSFKHYISNYALLQYGAQDDFDLSHTPNQRVQVDLLAGDISANPFGGTVLANFFTGATNFGWTSFSLDVTALLGAGTYSLRFAEVDNQSNFNYGVDDVSLDVSTVPEPGTVALVGFGMAALVGFKRRRRV